MHVCVEEAFVLISLRSSLDINFSCFLSSGLESVWKTHFMFLFGLLPGTWYLSTNLNREGTKFKDMAKVRFSCQVIDFIFKTVHEMNNKKLKVHLTC